MQILGTLLEISHSPGHRLQVLTLPFSLGTVLWNTASTPYVPLPWTGIQVKSLDDTPKQTK